MKIGVAGVMVEIFFFGFGGGVVFFVQGGRRR